MELGIDRLLKEKSWLKRLGNRRVGLVAHPASVTKDLVHTLDALVARKVGVTAAFGPQHGMRGEKQDNMVESSDYRDPVHGIPVFSLYGKVRRPTAEMLDTFDVLLIDMQDVGCRIYTFLTTLFYLMEDCAAAGGKEIWVLDRPNPAGRPVEGNLLDMKFASFVGAAPVPMRHGLTLGEAALWYKDFAELDLPLEIVEMKGYKPDKKPEFGWPASLPWVNPSPNMPRLTTARQYAGTVMLEGTKISEGRGTTRPLENFGAPDVDSVKVLSKMNEKFSKWMKGCALRPQFYEPTFHKFKGQLVNALQIYVDDSIYNPKTFKPYRLIAAYLKSVRMLYPDYDLWLPPPYEYEKVKMPIDILSGNSYLREWVDASSAAPGDLEKYLARDEKFWTSQRRRYLLYK